MPAATIKAELLAIAHAEFATLDVLIRPLMATATALGAVGPTISDVAGHPARWIDRFLTRYLEGRGTNWRNLTRVKAALPAGLAGLNWEDAKELLAAAAAEVIDFLERLSDNTVLGRPMPGLRRP